MRLFITFMKAILVLMELKDLPENTDKLIQKLIIEWLKFCYGPIAIFFSLFLFSFAILFIWKNSELYMVAFCAGAISGIYLSLWMSKIEKNFKKIVIVHIKVPEIMVG